MHVTVAAFLVAAGVIIFGVHGSEISSARFYLEPVELGGGSVDDAIREATST